LILFFNFIFYFEKILLENTLDLLLLKELIAKMGGTEIVEDVTDTQLLAQAGGPTLRADVKKNKDE